MSELDITSYPNEIYVIENRDYGYKYCRVTFLDVTEALPDEDMWAIIEKFRGVLLDYLDRRET